MRWLMIWMIASCSVKPDLLMSANPDERREAVYALGHASDRRAAIEKLAPVLRSDPDEEVRAAAAFALGKLGSTEPTPFLVEKALSLDTPHVRGPALLALGKTRDPAAIPAIIALWRRDDATEIFSKHALREIGRPAIEPLLALAFDREERVRIRLLALETLRWMNDPSIRARVAPLLEDPNHFIRFDAQQVLDAHAGAPAP